MLASHLQGWRGVCVSKPKETERAPYFRGFLWVCRFPPAVQKHAWYAAPFSSRELLHLVLKKKWELDQAQIKESLCKCRQCVMYI